jgi:murein DD-endopeptidase MepM/ murein hydrolase activator NlpD
MHRPLDGYTLVHGGRQVRIGPIAFWITVGTLVVMAVWSIATGTYFAFREDVLTRLIGRQADMQIAYEDRIAELRAQVDRITSRQLLDQEQFEQKLNELLRREAMLESRTNALGGEVLTGSIKSDKPLLNDTVKSKTRPDRDARNSTGLADTLTRVSRALDQVEHNQAMLLTDAEQALKGKVRRVRGVLDELGVDPKVHSGPALGGPFVPVKPPKPGASAFERQLYRVGLARAQVDRLNRALTAVPVRKPVAGDLDMSSPFGVRSDPFLGRPAMHTGIDLRGDIGEPVHATATGTVTVAGWDGGYGKMVEIDHGNGLATRYGHLSEIDVKVGQRVRIGEVIGKIGSTGRSTGPHLHYETRLKDEPVDPQKYLLAGVKLGTL